MLHVKTTTQTKKKGKKRIWKESEEHLLFHVWKNYLMDLRKTKKTTYVYLQMSVDFQEKHSIIVSAKEIQRKINNLSQKYRAEKAKSGSSPSTWKYFNNVHELIGNFDLNIKKVKNHENGTELMDTLIKKEEDSDDDDDAEEDTNSLSPAPFMFVDLEDQDHNSDGSELSESIPSPAQSISNPPSPTSFRLEPTTSSTSQFSKVNSAFNKRRKRTTITEKLLLEIKQTNELIKKDSEDMKKLLEESNRIDREWLNVIKLAFTKDK